jgi:hypothetical protein
MPARVDVLFSFGSIFGLNEGFHFIALWHFITQTNLQVQEW